MTPEHPTREAPWIDPATGTLVWRETDPASGVVAWFWKAPETQAVTEMVDGDTVAFASPPSPRGRPGPNRDEIRRRVVSEGLLRARLDEGHSIANAALLGVQKQLRYTPPMGLTEGARANAPQLKTAQDAEKRAADVVRTNHYQVFSKIAPEVIPDLLWAAVERVFDVVKTQPSPRDLRSVLRDVLTSFEGEDRDTIERSAGRVLDYARDLLRAYEGDSN